MALPLIDQILDDQQETVEDVEQLTKEGWQYGATLWGTDWTTETLISQLVRGNIELNPNFQRRNAWRDARKSKFIESLLLGLPVPEIILAESRTNRGSFVVIDGKQRLLTLLQFSAQQPEKFPPLKLYQLEELPELNGLDLPALKQNSKYGDIVRQFENQTVRTTVIRGWSDENYLYSVFLRINSGSVQLSPQELRQALHPGPFSEFVDLFSMNSVGLKKLLNLKDGDFRMRDAELALRFFAYKNFAQDYRGNLKRFLDIATKIFNDDWARWRPVLEEQGKLFERALAATSDVFGAENAFRKWKAGKFEAKVNRAIFDVMIYYFSDPAVLNASVGEAKEKIRAAFVEVSETSEAFLAAVESTTKSIGANRDRFAVWAKALSAALGKNLECPIPSE